LARRPPGDEEVDLVLLAFRTFRQKLPMPKRLGDDELRRITTPTLLLLGADTRLYDPGKVAERARRLLPDVQVEITPNAGHGLPIQYPDRITARILRFLGTERTERTGPAAVIDVIDSERG
jgi:pimeloyl-ACP methyl ester carboxylesterase